LGLTFLQVNENGAQNDIHTLKGEYMGILIQSIGILVGVASFFAPVKDFSGVYWSGPACFAIPMLTILGGIAAISVRIKQHPDKVEGGMALESLVEFSGVFVWAATVWGLRYLVATIWQFIYLFMIPWHTWFFLWILTSLVTALAVIGLGVTFFYDVWDRIKQFFRPTTPPGGRVRWAVVRYQKRLAWLSLVLAAWWVLRGLLLALT
jgi:hypothetical protein